MDDAGAQELLLPIVQPLELWQRTGRDKAYGPLMFRLNDRKETGFALAPTAEEVITVTVSNEYGSYRDLPVNVYQINWKYRDELRPRFGLLRSREFLMKDAYSFDADIEGLKASYKLMYDAYHRVFERCGLSFRPGGGPGGRDRRRREPRVHGRRRGGGGRLRLVPQLRLRRQRRSRGAGRAGRRATPAGADAMTPVNTPDLPGIKGVAEFLGVEPNEMLKCIAFDVDGEMGLALVPGDREVNPFALNQALAGRKVRLWEDADFDAHPDVPKGYIGPHFPGATVRVADPAVGVGPAAGWVTGANQIDHHVRHAVLGRDFDVDTFADLVTVVTGDACPRCGSPLSVDRGIEVGHTFQLGTKYSVALGADYTDETGQQHPMVMGCYGIGVSRVVAAVVEEHHDANGLVWPAALAPYQVHLVGLPGKGEAAPEVRAAADRLYDELRAAGVDVLYDDRDQSPGVKFADADLLGVPIQLVLGGKGLARGVVERKDRGSGERDEVALEAVVGVISGR